MAIKLKTGPKVLLALIIGIAVVFGVKQAVKRGWIPESKIFTSLIPKSAALPTVQGLSTKSAAPEAPLPSKTPVTSSKGVRALIWAWNAQMGWLFANGGPVTTEGSLMEKHGVKMSLVRQDDANQMQAELIKFAKALKDGNPQPTEGVHFVAVMGDGSPAFLAALNEQLEKLGSDYRAQVIGSAGFSRGEDKFMGPKEWKENPRMAKGGVVAGVLRDGDWNIAMKWCADNSIKNNPDEKTYDSDALNWVSADSYTDAAQKYVAGYAEERTVVKDGK